MQSERKRLDEEMIEGINILDKICIWIDKVIDEIKESADEMKEEDIDTEEVINEATKALTKENEILRQREIPSYLIIRNGLNYCPGCDKEITEKTNKWCPNCGQRIMSISSYKYTDNK